MISKGQKVKIKPEWQDCGDEKYEWFAIEDEEGGRVKIQPIIPGLEIRPVTVINTSALFKLDE